MHKCSSTILYAACTFRPYKSTPVLKLFRTFTGKMTRGLSLQMVFSPLFVEILFTVLYCTVLYCTVLYCTVLYYMIDFPPIRMSRISNIYYYLLSTIYYLFAARVV